MDLRDEPPLGAEPGGQATAQRGGRAHRRPSNRHCAELRRWRCRDRLKLIFGLRRRPEVGPRRGEEV